MGVTCRSDVDCHETLDLIGKRLRQDSESVTREALPTRWVDLILYLAEQERESAQPKPGKHARVSRQSV